MAVTFDSTFEKGSTATLSPFSFVSNAGTVSGTVGANSNRVLITTLALSVDLPGLAVTWAGAGMTQITSATTAGSRKVYLYGLINPATGNQTLSVSWTGGGFSASIALGAVSLYNADQVTGWANGTTNTGTSAAPTIVVTTTSGDMAVSGRADDNSSGGWSVSPGTLDWNETALDGNYGEAHNAASGTSTTITWAIGSSVAWAMAGVSVLQTAAAVVEGGGTLIVRPRLWVY